MTIAGLARDWDETRYAGFWIRVAANALDVLLLAVLNQVALLASGGARVFTPNRTLGSFSLSLGFADIAVGGILPPLMIIGCWIALGASPGKLLLGLRIVDEGTGLRPTPWQCLGRYVMAMVGVLCAGLGFLWIAFDPRHQGWHDKVARTLVVRRAPIA